MGSGAECVRKGLTRRGRGSIIRRCRRTESSKTPGLVSMEHCPLSLSGRRTGNSLAHGGAQRSRPQDLQGGFGCGVSSRGQPRLGGPPHRGRRLGPQISVGGIIRDGVCKLSRGPEGISRCDLESRLLSGGAQLQPLTPPPPLQKGQNVSKVRATFGPNLALKTPEILF